MTHLQEIRQKISDLEGRYASLHRQKETLEQAWSEKVKTAIPAVQAEMDVVLTALRNAEVEEHRIIWPRMRDVR
jgi:hypothetical protein